MSGFDASTVYSASVFNQDNAANSATATESLFVSFIQEFQLDRSFVYREQLRTNCMLGQLRLRVDVAHLISFNEELAHRVSSEPAELLPLVIRYRTLDWTSSLTRQSLNRPRSNVLDKWSRMQLCTIVR